MINLQLHRFALMVAWLGASIGITAGMYKGISTGSYPVVLLVAAVITLLATIPVYRQNKRTQ